MPVYDILVLVVIVGATVYGAFKGFAWQLASIASIGLSYVVAFRFRTALAESIRAAPPWNHFLAMLILFVGTSLIVWVAFRMARAWIDRLSLHEFDRHVGAVFGFIKGGLYVALGTLFAVTLSGDRVRDEVVSSRSGHAIAGVIAKSESVIPSEVHDFIGPYLADFDARIAAAEAPNERAAGSAAPVLARPSGEPFRPAFLPETRVARDGQPQYR